MKLVPLFLAFFSAVAWGAASIESEIISTAAGYHVGNAGTVVLCKNEDGSKKSFMISDFFESPAKRSIPPGELISSVKALIDRIEGFDPHRAARYKKKAEHFLAATEFTDTLPAIPHLGIPFLKLSSNCKRLQIAAQHFPFEGQTKLYFIHKDLWEQLDHQNKVGLVLHEIATGEAMLRGIRTPISSQILTIAMSRAEPISAEEYFENLAVALFREFPWVDPETGRLWHLIDNLGAQRWQAEAACRELVGSRLPLPEEIPAGLTAQIFPETRRPSTQVWLQTTALGTVYDLEQRISLPSHSYTEAGILCVKD